MIRRIESSPQAFENLVDIIHSTEDKFTVVNVDGDCYTLCNPILRTLTDACLWAEGNIGGSFVIPTVDGNPRYGDGVWTYLIVKVS